MAAGRKREYDVLLRGLSQGLERLAQQIERLDNKLDEIDGRRATATVDVDTKRADAKLGAFSRDLQNKIREATKDLGEIDIRIDTSDAEREVEHIRRQLVTLADKRIGIDIGAEQAQAELERLTAALAKVDRDDVRVSVNADIDKALADLGAVSAAADKLDGKRVKIDIDAGRGIAETTVQLAALARAIALLSVVAAIPLALPGLAGMGAAIVELSGALGLLPAVGFAAAASIATLVIGFQGFGAALKSGDTPGQIEKINEAMAGLAPSARETVTQIKALGPAWSALQLDVQQRLFQGVGQVLGVLARQQLPVLRTGLLGVAEGLNLGVRLWAAWANNTPQVQSLATIFTNLKTAMMALAPVGRDFAAALTDITVVGSTFLPGLASGLAGAAAQFRAFIAEARQTGQLAQWIQTGITAVGQLGSILGNVGGILSGVFQAAEAAGAGFLATLDRLTQAMSNWVNSARGQDVLINLFTTLRQVVDNLLPGLEAIGDAIAQAFSTLGPVLPVVAAAFSQLAAALAPAIPMLASMAAAIAPVVTGFASVVSALGPVGPVILAATVGFIAFRTVLSSLIGGITALTAPIRAVGPALTQAGTAATTATTGVRALGTAAGTTGGAMGALRSGLSGLMGFLGGPLGIAITGVTVALGLLGAAQADAAAAAANHRSAVDSLKGTLDQVTGAITAATAAQVAGTLATEKLADGTTSYLAAAQKAGISAQDYTQAALGNEAALQRVNTALRAQATPLLQNSDAWKGFKPIFDEAGISLQTVTEGVLGNNAALDEMARLLPGGRQQLESFLGAARQGALGDLAQLAQKLGLTNAQIKQAGTELAQAAAATVDFSGKVLIAQGALAQFGQAAITSNGQILANAAGATELGTALAGVSTDAMAAATAAGQVAVAAGEAGKAGEAAAASMQTSRQAFLDAAAAAGIGKVEAEALANSMGLIPEAIQTIISSNADPVTAQMIMLAYQVSAVPGQKSVIVTAPLLPETIARLQTLGVDIKTLPNGQFEITPKTEAARAALEQLKTPTTSTHTVTPQNAAVEAVKGANLQATVSTHTVNPQNNVPPVTAQNQAPTQNPHTAGAPTTNNVPPTTAQNSAPTQNPHTAGAPTTNNVPPTTAANSAPTQNPHTAGAPVTNNVPAASAANSAPTTNLHTITVNTDAVNAARAINIQPTTSLHTITVNNDAPTAAIALNKQPTTSLHTITVNNDAVTAAKAANQAATSSTHTINVVVVGGLAAGGIVGMAAGGVIHPYASGGMEYNGHQLNPMSGGQARMVNPNTYRVIGDNQRHEELYAPIDGSRSSLAYIGYAANKFGYALTPMAEGGVVGGLLKAIGGAGTSERVWRRLQSSMSRSGGRSTGGAGSGMSAAGVEARLDRLTSVTAQLSDTLERRGAGASIVVEAAQDPVETARATRLAMRLA